VKLRDQFAPDGVEVGVLAPFEFCNPVEKKHGDVTTPIQNPKAHLACYSITPLPIQAAALTRNQFGSAQQPIGAADLLCVPSEKLRFAVVLGDGDGE
jgi:hypothetical protein